MFTKSKRVFTEHIYVPYVKHGDCFVVLCCCLCTEWFNKCTAWWNQKNTKAALERNVESSDRKLRHNGKTQVKRSQNSTWIEYLYILDLFSNKEPGTWQLYKILNLRTGYLSTGCEFELNWPHSTGSELEDRQRNVLNYNLQRFNTGNAVFFSTLNCPST